MRVVFDTNALISAALLRKSVSRQAFDKAKASGQILASLQTLTELRGVLYRPKFDRYLTKEERLQFLSVFVREAVLVLQP